MGINKDILDSSIIKHLQFGVVDSSNNVFKLFANVSPTIFWISSVLVIASSYIGDPIKCMTNNKMAETVCWIHGSYHVDEKISEEVYGSVCKRSYNTYGTELSLEEKDVDTAYYQWVPFMLFVHGLLFLIPGKIWTFLRVP